MNNEICKDIWLSLNQSYLKPINKELISSSSELIFSEVKQYFENHTKCKVINLRRLKEDDWNYFSEKKISLSYLIKNFERTINAEKDKITPDPRKFQLEAVKDKFIYAVCPFSGRLLRSNQSVFVTRSVIFYRFTSQEKLFYLITTNFGDGFTKGALYFPESELIIKADSEKWGFKRENIIQFKAIIVCNYQDFCNYFSNQNSNKRIAVIIGSTENFAHHLWNQLSGINRLYENKLLNKVDRFLVFREPLGEINQIFPEIPTDKIEKIKTDNEAIQEILKNNYLVVNVGDRFIKNDLANRVYKVAFNNCPSKVIDQVKEAKENFFPLLWISIRSHNRTWINQVDGLTKVIDSLAKKFPKMGVVFDGFSLPADRNLYPNRYQGIFEIIKRENEIVNEITQNLSNLKIGIFNTVGCSIFETNVWAHAIDIYLAHHGTIQHKVGWLANKQGIVHSNQKVLKNPYNYVGKAREFGIPPIYISHIHVKDTKIEGKEANDLRGDLDNYDLDWTVLYDEVLKLTKSITRKESFTTKLFNSGVRVIKPSIVLRGLKKKVKQTLRSLITSLDFSKI
jgi:hypothetical protein